MKTFQKLSLIIVFLLLVQTVHSDVEKNETIEKTFTFQSITGDQKLIVDNLFGAIEVTGDEGNEVHVLIEKTIHARSERQLQRALTEVVLDVTEDNNLVEFYVDGPFRCRNSRGINWKGFRREGYKVVYNFKVRIPYNTNIELKTVNEGDVTVQNVHGDFEVNNVNGSITMDKLQGSGEVYAVNGDVRLDFQRNPQNTSSFGSLNGDVHMYFQPQLSADFYLETFNGEFFTDFRVTESLKNPFHKIEKDGKTVYKAGHRCGVRAGKGGPEIDLKGFNGDMYILKK